MSPLEDSHELHTQARSRLSLVAIVGAGDIGGSTARALAARGRVSAIRLIDEHASVAAGKALDLRQSAPIIGSDTRIEGTTDVAFAAGATVIVLADAASGTDWSGESGLALVRRLEKLGCLQHAVLICAGAGHRTLMQLSVSELGVGRSRFLGSAPEAFAAVARSLVAIEARGSASQVTLAVLGNPPSHVVIPWAEASIAGHSVSSRLTPPQLHVVESRLKALWPPGPTALGTAAAVFCEAVVLGSRRVLSAFVSLDRDNGTMAPVCAWPVTVGPAGLERADEPPLTGRDRVVIDEVLENDAL
jgi:malate/lactate dehydrogenase